MPRPPRRGALVDRHAGRRIAVIAHGGTNRVILGEVLKLPLGNILRLTPDYAAWSLIEYRRDAAVVHAVNQRPGGTPGAPPVESTVPRQGGR